VDEEVVRRGDPSTCPSASKQAFKEHNDLTKFSKSIQRVFLIPTQPEK
jgi:hypothetical protein